MVAHRLGIVTPHGSKNLREEASYKQLNCRLLVGTRYLHACRLLLIHFQIELKILSMV